MLGDRQTQSAPLVLRSRLRLLLRKIIKEVREKIFADADADAGILHAITRREMLRIRPRQKPGVKRNGAAVLRKLHGIA